MAGNFDGSLAEVPGQDKRRGFNDQTWSLCFQKAFVELPLQLAATSLGQHVACADLWVACRGKLPA